MSIEENKVLVWRALEMFWNTHNPETGAEFYAPDLINNDPQAPQVTNLEGLKAYAHVLFTAFPDFHVVMHDEIAEGDKVAKVWSISGTHQGDFQGLPPTGKHVAMSGITVYRVVNDKIAELTWSYNLLGLLQQLGAIPVPA